jgi:beta-lactamase superfamily II metal-dependent hydrolase
MKKNLLGIIIFICALFIPTIAHADTLNGKIHFISSNTGDSMIIESNGHYGLVDALDSTEVSKVINYANALGVQKFDFVVMTHHHADSIGGIPALADFFDSNTIVFYKEDLLAPDDYEEQTLNLTNNQNYLTALQTFTNKSSKTCDVTKASSNSGADPACDLATLSNGAISSVSYEANYDYDDENSYLVTTQYDTKTREYLTFKFGNLDITLYSLYNVSYHHENLNSIVTLITYDYIDENDEAQTFSALLTGDIETALGDFDYSTTSSSSYIIQNPTDATGACTLCNTLGLEEQISDVVGAVDILKAANHGSTDSNAIYSLFRHAPKYYIITGENANGEPYDSITVPVTYLKNLNETESYLASETAGALVAELGADGEALIKEYGVNAIETDTELTNVSDSTFTNGWKEVYYSSVNDLALAYVENNAVVLNEWKNLVRNSAEHRYHFNSYGLADTGFYTDILKESSEDEEEGEGEESEEEEELIYGTDYKTYYLCEEVSCLGEMQTGGPRTIDGYKYYFRTADDDIKPGLKGEMLIGLAEINGNTYYFRQKEDEEFVGPQGSALVNGCVKVDEGGTEVLKCFDSNGILTVNSVPTPVPTTDLCSGATFNNEDQSITKKPIGGYTWSNNIRKTVGTQVVTATLKDGYYWDDNSQGDKTITCGISIAQIEKVELVTNSYEYTGEEIFPALNEYPEWAFNITTRNTADPTDPSSVVIPSPTDAGIYYTTFELVDTDNMEWIVTDEEGISTPAGTDPVVLEWAITATNRQEAPDTKDVSYPYDGNPHPLEVVSIYDNENVSYEYSETGLPGSWTDTVPTLTNVGTLIAFARVKADLNYGASPADQGSITITPQIVTKPTLSESSFVYNENTRNPEITGIDLTKMTVSGDTSATNAGTYTITVSLKDTANTKWDDNTVADVSLIWNITKSKKAQPTVSGYDEEYDGSAHTVNVTSSDAVEYSETGLADTWSDTAPTLEDVGAKTVHIRTKGNSNYEPSDPVTAIINIRARKITKPTLATTSFTYSGNLQTPTINGYDSNLMNISGDTSGSTVGQYTITVSLKDSSNNVWADESTEDVELTWEIIKDIYPSPVVSSYSGKYDGQPHQVLVSGEGTIKYSTDNSTWGDVLPTRTDVGTTTVYAKRIGDSNYDDSYVVHGTITISKADITAPTVTSYTGNYDGSPHTITVGTATGGTIKYSTDKTNWSTTKPTRTDAGVTTVYVKVFGDQNHNDSLLVSGTITINEDTTYEIKNYTVDESKKYINKIIVGTDLETFKSNIVLGSGYSVVVDTKTVNGKKLLYTGGKTKIMHGTTVVKEYTNIVIGDTNGDGLTNSADLLRLRQHLLGTKLLTGVYFIASDINYDNTINSADLLRVRQHLLGTKYIN